MATRPEDGEIESAKANVSLPGSWGMRATISSRVIAIVARSVADCARPGLKVFNPVGGEEKYRRLGIRRSVSRREC
jgi:hypothetical protein